MKQVKCPWFTFKFSARIFPPSEILRITGGNDVQVIVTVNIVDNRRIASDRGIHQALKRTEPFPPPGISVILIDVEMVSSTGNKIGIAIIVHVTRPYPSRCIDGIKVKEFK